MRWRPIDPDVQRRSKLHFALSDMEQRRRRNRADDRIAGPGQRYHVLHGHGGRVGHDQRHVPGGDFRGTQTAWATGANAIVTVAGGVVTGRCSDGGSVQGYGSGYSELVVHVLVHWQPAEEPRR